MTEDLHCQVNSSPTEWTECQVRGAWHATAHMTTPESQNQQTISHDDYQDCLSFQEIKYWVYLMLKMCKQNSTLNSSIVKISTVHTENI